MQILDSWQLPRRQPGVVLVTLSCVDVDSVAAHVSTSSWQTIRYMYYSTSRTIDLGPFSDLYYPEITDSSKVNFWEQKVQLSVCYTG